MKKIVASVGLVALGASSFYSTASAQGVIGPDTSKPWSVSAALRGFYDDNISTIPNDTVLGPDQHRDVYGLEVSPAATLNWNVPQTTINLGAQYSYKQYDRTPIGSTDNHDQTFSFTGDLSHSFSEMFKARVADSFVIGQEPDLIRAGNAFATFQRLSGDNIRNYGSLSLDAQFTPRLGASLGYDNAYYDYAGKGESVAPSGYFYASGPLAGQSVPGVAASPAGALNRIENRIHIEGLYSLGPETKGILGYNFTDVSFTGNELIGGFLIDPAAGVTPANIVNPIYSKNRNYREHIVYLGASHNFSPQMTGNIRAGASYTDYYNDSTQDPSYTPYVTADLKYTYGPESYVDVGFSYDRNATDVVGLLGSGGFTVDSEAAVVFANVSHRFTPQLFANVMAQFQNSLYNGGIYDGQSEQYYLAGLDFEYRFAQYVSAHVGYNYDRLQSELGRTYDRNRVYIGVTASY